MKRKLTEDDQLNLFTKMFEYRAILTSNTEWSTVEIAQFYNHRGNMEKQFDILKNDFGWNYMLFSKLHRTPYFIYTAFAEIYITILSDTSQKHQALKPTSRLKSSYSCLSFCLQNG